VDAFDRQGLRLHSVADQMVRTMKASYSSLLGFQIQFYLGELSIKDKIELIYNLIESLPYEEKVKIKEDLDKYLEE